MTKRREERKKERERERERRTRRRRRRRRRTKSKVRNLLDLMCNHSIDIEIFIRSCRVAHGPRFPWIVNHRDKKVRGGGGGISRNS